MKPGSGAALSVVLTAGCFMGCSEVEPRQIEGTIIAQEGNPHSDLIFWAT
jgi:hypothetical protein